MVTILQVTYTFQSEFERLCLPSLHEKLVPHFLKSNYLERDALVLLKNIEDLEIIWTRLKDAFGDAFGDASLLLKIKSKSIEKTSPIWKLKDEQKLVQALTNLSFVMLKLQSLPDKHDIENNLFYGGDIQKVYEVIGFAYRDNFIRKQGKLNLSEKQVWEKLVEFIQEEAKGDEKINLVEKSSV